MAPDESASDDALSAVHLRRTAEVVGLAEAVVTPPRATMVRAAGRRVHVLDWEGSGPAVVLLHGYGLNAHTWDAVALGLRTTHRCLAVDQLGHGRSEWGSSHEYTLEARAAAVDAVVDELGLDSMAVVGQSLGGLVALEVGARANSRVAALAIVDASPFSSGRTGVGSRFRGRTFGSVDEAFELVRRANPERDPELLRRNLELNLRRLPDRRWTWRYDVGDAMLEPEDRSARTARLVSRLEEIRVPTLVVRGEASEVVDPEAAAVLARRLSDGRLAEIPSARHNVQGDSPLALASTLLRFFRDVGHT